jgi:hypothetical protein
VFMALAVAFSGKFDTTATTVTVVVAFLIGTYGIYSHCSKKSPQKVLALLLVIEPFRGQSLTTLPRAGKETLAGEGFFPSIKRKRAQVAKPRTGHPSISNSKSLKAQ